MVSRLDGLLTWLICGLAALLGVQTEEKIIKALQQEGGRRQDGAAALCAVLARNVLYVANAGDCRAVLVS